MNLQSCKYFLELKLTKNAKATRLVLPADTDMWDLGTRWLPGCVRLSQSSCGVPVGHISLAGGLPPAAGEMAVTIPGTRGGAKGRVRTR
jgi:hypothetical protein